MSQDSEESAFKKQLEEANNELEQAINANNSFRRNVLEPQQQQQYSSSATNPVLPSSITHRPLGNFSNSLLNKWAQMPVTPSANVAAAASMAATNFGGGLQLDASGGANNNHHHPHSSSATSSSSRSSCHHCGGTANIERIDAMLQNAFVKESERVDNQVKEMIARDADARAQHLDNVLRGRFAELQAHSEQTGQVLTMIGESLKNVKTETGSLQKQFEEKSSKIVESATSEAKLVESALERSVGAIEKRLKSIEEQMQTERMTRQTRLDALELQVQKLHSSLYGHVDKRSEEIRSELRSLDSDVAALHREWAKTGDAVEETRYLKQAMRDIVDDCSSQRSEIRQIKSDVLNLDVFMRVKAQNRSSSSSSSSSASGFVGDSSSSSSSSELQVLRESVSFLAAAMKHHGLLNLDGEPNSSRKNKTTKSGTRHHHEQAGENDADHEEEDPLQELRRREKQKTSSSYSSYQQQQQGRRSPSGGDSNNNNMPPLPGLGSSLNLSTPTNRNSFNNNNTRGTAQQNNQYHHHHHRRTSSGGSGKGVGGAGGGEEQDPNNLLDGGVGDDETTGTLPSADENVRISSPIDY